MAAAPTPMRCWPPTACRPSAIGSTHQSAPRGNRLNAATVDWQTVPAPRASPAPAGDARTDRLRYSIPTGCFPGQRPPSRDRRAELAGAAGWNPVRTSAAGAGLGEPPDPGVDASPILVRRTVVRTSTAEQSESGHYRPDGCTSRQTHPRGWSGRDGAKCVQSPPRVRPNCCSRSRPCRPSGASAHPRSPSGNRRSTASQTDTTSVRPCS